MDVSFSAQILLGLITVVGAGVASYVGIRVGIVENRRDIAHLNDELKRLEKDIDRIDDRLDRFREKMIK